MSRLEGHVMHLRSLVPLDLPGMNEELKDAVHTLSHQNDDLKAQVGESLRNLCRASLAKPGTSKLVMSVERGWTQINIIQIESEANHVNLENLKVEKDMLGRFLGEVKVRLYRRGESSVPWRRLSHAFARRSSWWSGGHFQDPCRCGQRDRRAPVPAGRVREHHQPP